MSLMRKVMLSSPELDTIRPSYRRAGENRPFLIDRLPYDVLLHVFHTLCDSANPAGRLPVALSLASVCATWRRLVLDDVCLWSTLYVSGLQSLGALPAFLPYSGSALVELSLDLFRVHADPEPTRRPINDIMETINRHISRVRMLKLVLHADSYDSLGRLCDPATALRELSITVPSSHDKMATERDQRGVLQLPLPQLHKLSVFGIPHPGFSGALVPSLRILEFSGWKLHPSVLHDIFRLCPHLQELHIRDFCVVAITGDTDNLEPIDAPCLRVLCLDRTSRDIPHSPLVVTPRAVSQLPLRRITTISLKAMTGETVLAEATACFQSSGAVRSLEFSHAMVDMDWKTVHIRASTSSGMERSLDVFVPDNEDMDPYGFVSVARALGAADVARTIKYLVIPLDWAMAFLLNTDFTLRELETLKLTFTPGCLSNASMSDQRPPGQPQSCPYLRTVILDVDVDATDDENYSVVQDTLPLIRPVLSSMIAFDKQVPLSATLVLSQSFIVSGVVLDDLKSLFEEFAIL